MNVAGTTELETQTTNVVALFGELDLTSDPLRELLAEGQIDRISEELEFAPKANRRVVSESQFPDQSLHTLDMQLASLKESLARIKFYLGDVDDLLPR